MHADNSFRVEKEVIGSTRSEPQISADGEASSLQEDLSFAQPQGPSGMSQCIHTSALYSYPTVFIILHFFD
eukprot:scaffold104743_cov21-Prasinocladus_malaysianus.AAC.1